MKGKKMIKGFITICMVLLLTIPIFIFWFVNVPTGIMLFPDLAKSPLNKLIEYKWDAGESVSDNIQAVVNYSDNDCCLTFHGEGHLIHFESTEDFRSWHSLESMSVGWLLPINNVIIEDGITSIGEYTFTNIKLDSITISESIVSIADNVFYNCISNSADVVEINYNGSMEQWNSITKGDNWCNETSMKYIQSINCSDGKVTLINSD